MNDDLFFGRPLSPSDFYIPLYGFVFRIQVDTVSSTSFNEACTSRGYFRQRKEPLPRLNVRPGDEPQDLAPEVDEEDENDNLERIKNSFSHTPGFAAILPRDATETYYQYCLRFSPESSYTLVRGKEEEKIKVLSDLSRYNYVIGSAPSHFRVFFGVKGAQYEFRVLEQDYEEARPFTYLSLNDALDQSENWPKFSKSFLSFFSRRFPMPTPWEKGATDAGQNAEEPGPPNVNTKI